MANHDEETGLLNGEPTHRRGSMFTSPTAVIFALMLVVGAFVGGSVVTHTDATHVVGAEEHGNSNHVSVVAPDTPAHTAASSSSSSSSHHHQHKKTTTSEATTAATATASNDDDAANTGSDESDDAGGINMEMVTQPVERALQQLLTPFKEDDTPKLLERVRANVAAVIAADSSYKEDLGSVADDIDLDKNTKLAKAVEELDGKPDPEWMSSTDNVLGEVSDDAPTIKGKEDRRRRLLGGGAEDLMARATALSTALKIEPAEVMSLFANLGSNAPAFVEYVKKAAAEEEKEETTQDYLMLAAVDLTVVAGRSAPEPFGRDVPDVFDASWNALLKILANLDVKTINDVIKNAAGSA